MVLRPAVLTFLFVFLGLLALDQKSRAAGDLVAQPKPNAVELVVFEHQDCTYCRAFRSDTLPLYRSNGQDVRAPVRFVRVEHSDTSTLNLNGRIEMVPTFVLMQNGRELGRIEGYWAPDNFFKMLSHLMLRAED